MMSAATEDTSTVREVVLTAMQRCGSAQELEQRLASKLDAGHKITTELGNCRIGPGGMEAEFTVTVKCPDGHVVSVSNS